jgi:hypothetical protein
MFDTWLAASIAMEYSLAIMRGMAVNGLVTLRNCYSSGCLPPVRRA